MFLKPKYAKPLNYPNFYLNSEVINIVDEYIYLGHIICDDLSDERNINKQKRKLYGQGNTIIRKF